MLSLGGAAVSPFQGWCSVWDGSSGLRPWLLNIAAPRLVVDA